MAGLAPTMSGSGVSRGWLFIGACNPRDNTSKSDHDSKRPADCQSVGPAVPDAAASNVRHSRTYARPAPPTVGPAVPDAAASTSGTAGPTQGRRHREQASVDMQER